MRDHFTIFNNNSYTMQCRVALKFGGSHGCVIPDWSLHDKSSHDNVVDASFIK